MGTLRILGLDIAALNSGAAVVEVRADKPGEIAFKVLEERHLKTVRIAASQPPSWESMLNVSAQAVDLAEKYDIKHIGYEGFAKGWGGGGKKKEGNKGRNTTAYEHAELVGVIKYRLWNIGDMTFLQVPPTTLTSFFSLPKGDKGAVPRMLKEQLGWVSRQRYVKERSDCSDAVALAMAAGYVFSILGGWDPADSLEPGMQRIIFGDERKSTSMIGLLRRPHLYIPRDACVAEEHPDD